MGYDEAFYIATKLNTAVATEHNPSYVPVIPNPSYTKATKDDYNYVQPNEFNDLSEDYIYDDVINQSQSDGPNYCTTRDTTASQNQQNDTIYI